MDSVEKMTKSRVYPLTYCVDPVNGTCIVRMHPKHERLRQLLFLNEYQYFVLVTYPAMEGGFLNFRAVVRELRSWLDRQVVEKKLRYILIPEYDKEFGRLVVHLLVNDVFDLVDDGECDGRQLYRVSDWPFGVAIASKIPLEEPGRLFAYMSKFCDKVDLSIFRSRFWYR